MIDPADLLTDAQKAAIVEQRVQAWAADAFGHQLNKAAVLAADPGADVSESDAAIAAITKAVDQALESVKGIDTSRSEILTRAETKRAEAVVKPGRK